MAIFGEETVEVDIFKGLSLNVIMKNKSFCERVINLVKTDSKEYTIREDLVLIQDVVFASLALRTIPLTDPIPRNIVKKDIEIFTATGSQTADSPTMLVCVDNAITLKINWLNCNSVTPVSYEQTLPAAHGVKAFCQYKDRYYASNGTSNIFRLATFSIVPATALTVTDLAAVGVNFLVAFKNRIFGFTKNRIYFTDLPAIGLYPETWNLVTNFIDLPSVDFDVTIHNVKVYKDKIYIFTDKGIYYLMANGDPLNWAIQLVTQNFPVYDRDSVCISKNLIFLTDQTAIYTFDGSKFTRISDSIKAVFSLFGAIYNIVNIYPFEDGILVTQCSFNVTAGNYVSTNADKSYYFDFNIWSEITLPVTDVSSAILRAGASFLPYRGKPASSYIVYYLLAGTHFKCVFLDSGMWKGDTLSLDHVAGARLQKFIQIVTPALFLEERRYTFYKNWILYGYINQNDPVDLLIGGRTLVSTDMFNGSSVYKAPISSVTESRYDKETSVLNIYGNIGSNKTYSAGLFQVPPLVIRKIEVVVNTDSRDTTETRES